MTKPGNSQLHIHTVLTTQTTTIAVEYIIMADNDNEKEICIDSLNTDIKLDNEFE